MRVMGMVSCCLIMACVQASPPAVAPVAVGGASAQQAAALQALVDAAARRNLGHGGAVLRIDGPQGMVWEGARGMHVHDSFEIASITKIMVATVTLQLAEEGALALDAPVGESATPWLGAPATFTWRQLLGHTSGLPDYWSDPPVDADGNNAFLRAFLADPQHRWMPTELLNYVRTMPRVGPAGGPFHYCDSGYVLLGLLLEKLTGQPLHTLLEARLFVPLGMQHTFMRYVAGDGAPQAHRFEEDVDLHDQARQSADWAGGGLVSTTADLQRFMTALAAGTLFKNATSLQAMQRWQATGSPSVSYGLGAFAVQVAGDTAPLWGHDGHGNAFMYVWPARGWVFTGTLNQTHNDWWPLVQSAMQVLSNPEP